MSDRLPSVVDRFSHAHPAVWEAYNRLNDAAAESGPIEPKLQRLLKLAIAVGANLQGAVHSHARRGQAAGWSAEELSQVAHLAITTIGWPRAFAAHCWINDVLEERPPAEA